MLQLHKCANAHISVVINGGKLTYENIGNHMFVFYV